MGNINALHTAFPLDADREYAMQVDVILSTLKLNEVRERELARIKGKPTSHDETVRKSLCYQIVYIKQYLIFLTYVSCCFRRN